MIEWRRGNVVLKELKVLNKLFRRVNDWDKVDKVYLIDGIKIEVLRLWRVE